MRNTTSVSSIRRRIILVLKFILLLSLLYVEIFQLDIIPDFNNKNSYVNAFLFYLSSNLVIDLCLLAITRLYTRRRLRAHLIINQTFLLGIKRIASAALVISLATAILILFSINLRELFTSLSIVAAALAITFKDYISNFINGLIIMFSDELSLGDYVKINNTRGKIINITFINTHLLSDDEDSIFIPNNTVVNSETVNYTQRIVNRINFEFEMAHIYLKDLGDLESKLCESIKDFEEYIQKETYNLKIVNITKDVTMLKFQYTLIETNLEVERKIRRQLGRSTVQYIQEQLNTQ